MFHKIILATLVFVGLFNVNVFAQEEQSLDHESLRTILKTSKEAINTKNLDLLKPIISGKNLTIITVDNKKFTTLEAFSNYWEKLFKGPNAILEDIKIDPQAESITKFLTKDVGIVDGTSTETYHFKDGDVRLMNIRWTAVVQKEEGAWKIVNIHFSPSLMDNPVIHALKDKVKYYVISAAVLCFIVGALTLAFIRRRKAA